MRFKYTGPNRRRAVMCGAAFHVEHRALYSLLMARESNRR
jgi:hypothetical protein